MGGHHRHDHGGVFAALGFMHRGGVGQNQLVQFHEFVED
jgi:hypothetical protein